ncbi:E3 ubiquitin-protein ligase MARCH6 [Apostasia shenzhenica]|uniref:E3 ubiquitin-protein ligase MARCH6 n=1 Tax=Apostasia shenzhenica TaxID=1088818 RepID=A0A2I0B6V8_9ASPA|nr:E3 ubiquitin-protein ligase MARCH6 [Apostasia shenzhenica]
MGEHLALLVDRLLTESTLESAIGGRKRTEATPSLVSTLTSESELDLKVNASNGTFSAKLVECRICQDEDEDSNMEAPCSCCGSLKYAHRKCVQRWCDEKGNTTCEICQQQFKPGYTATPQLFYFGRMSFRERDALDSRNITLSELDHDFIDSDYDYYATSRARSSIYCRSVAIIFMTLLILRHILPFILSGAEDANYSVTLFTVSAFGAAGVFLPIVIIIKAAFLCRRHQQHRNVTISEEEAARSRAHIIQIH